MFGLFFVSASPLQFLKALQDMQKFPMMMLMIAFITIKSGLVPMIEGLCAQIYHFSFEIISGLRSHILLFFFEEKIFSRKKAVSPRSLPAS